MLIVMSLDNFFKKKGKKSRLDVSSYNFPYQEGGTSFTVGLTHKQKSLFALVGKALNLISGVPLQSET
jgi:hypothetical protein